MTGRRIRQLVLLAALPLAAACSPFPAHLAAGPATPPAPGTASANCSPDSNQAGDSYVVFGHRYHVLARASGYDDRGIASWYGPNFHGKLTSSGASYDMYAMTAANKVLPLCTWVKVTNLENGRNAIVQVNDRGPFVANRIIDLSYAAAKRIGMIRNGTALVDVRAIASPSKTPPANLEQVSKTYPAPRLHHRPELYVQVGAFSEQDNAERLRARLVLRQLGSIAISPTSVNGHKYFRVLVGPLATVNQVDTLTARLDHLGYSETSVVIQ